MVFVALCFALGDQHFFHPSIKLKYVAMLVLLLGLFSILATNDTSALVGYLALAGFTYGYVYFHGRYQSARIPRRQRSFNEREEQRRLLKSSVAKDAFEASYDAKLRPRAELSDEHPAVEKVDAVLEKISRSGMQSLTAAERQMLERASQDLRAKDT
jgi:Ca2+/Na+ antiporter